MDADQSFPGSSKAAFRPLDRAWTTKRASRVQHNQNEEIRRSSEKSHMGKKEQALLNVCDGTIAPDEMV